jgi:ribosomal protein S6--L-glutamate ligase
MRIVSFDVFRSLHIPDVHYIKPEHFLQHLEAVRTADWVLFPEYWQVNSLYYGLNSRIFPSIGSYHLGHDKVEMTRAFQVVCPDNIPETWIEAGTPEGIRALQEKLDFPFVAKEVRSSEGRGVFKIETELEWHRYCRGRPVLYAQEYLPINRDLRVVVIGERIAGCYWRLQSADGFHNNIAAGGQLDFAPAPAAAVELVERVSRTLRIDHAGFDIAMVGDRPYILEFNRLFGNHGLSEQDIKPAELIYQYLLQKHSAGKKS